MTFCRFVSRAGGYNGCLAFPIFLHHDPNRPASFTPAERTVSKTIVSKTKFDYYNEVGDRAGRFNIDLYMSDGGDGCGTYVTSVCDKPAIGCKDSSEKDHRLPFVDLAQGEAWSRCSWATHADVGLCSALP